MRYRLLLAIIGPFVLWAVYFTLFYGIQAVGCSAGWDVKQVAGFPLLRTILIGLSVLTILLSTVTYRASRTVDTDMMGRVARNCALAGLVSTLVIFIGVFWLKLC